MLNKEEIEEKVQQALEHLNQSTHPFMIAAAQKFSNTFKKNTYIQIIKEHIINSIIEKGIYLEREGVLYKVKNIGAYTCKFGNELETHQLKWKDLRNNYKLVKNKK